MFRTVENELIKWKNDQNKKPLIVRGARQIGKSWIIEHFGKENYKGKLHIINFEKRPDLNIIFEINFDVKRIIYELEIQLNTSIDASKDLVFFDEIQACPKALMSLRYFYEDMPQLQVISAGSLLDFVLKEIPYPVGRVEHLDMHPMSFYEFLLAMDQSKLAEIIKQEPHSLPESIDKALKQQVQKYMMVGGMPRCIKTLVDTNSMPSVAKVQNDLLFSLKEDFKKYNPSVSFDCLDDILTSIMANIGGQIKYTRLSERFSGPTIKKGFGLLKMARILSQVQNVSAAGLPLMPSGIQFKAYFLDIGLLIRALNLPVANELMNGSLLASFKGALAEQFVAQELRSSNTQLHFWMNQDAGTISEVDFVIEKLAQIMPIEVKSGSSGSLKSLHILLKKYPNIKQGLVFSNAKFGLENNIQFLPIYWAGGY